MGVIDDFVKSNIAGSGEFKGDLEALAFVATMGANQRKQWMRYGQVPLAFLLYLKEVGALFPEEAIPIRGKRSIGEICELVDRFGFDNKQHGEYVRKLLTIQSHSELGKSFSSADHIWRKLQPFAT